MNAITAVDNRSGMEKLNTPVFFDKKDQLASLAHQLLSFRKEKEDYLYPANEISFAATENEHGGYDPLIEFGSDDYPVTQLMTQRALQQAASYYGVPIQYARRMLNKFPALFCDNMNAWAANDDDNKRRMIRTQFGVTRAFMSDAYKIMDNDLVLATAVAATEKSSYDFEPHWTGITSDKMRVCLSIPQSRADVKLNDPIEFGVMISNSEVGSGSLAIDLYVKRLICHNGMTFTDSEKFFKRTHVGRRFANDLSRITLNADTIAAETKAMQLLVRDAMESVMQDDVITQYMHRMTSAAHSDPVSNPREAIESVRKIVQITDTESDRILENLIRDRDYTRWGLANAVTYAAHNASGDRVAELQKIGGDVIDLSENNWSEIAQAA